jgi:hypothetical protein
LRNRVRETALLFMLCMIALSGACNVFGQDTTPTPPDYTSSWILIFDGAVNRPLSLSVGDLEALPKTEAYGSIYCDRNLVTQGTWGGVLVSYLVNQAGLAPDATNLEFRAYDGYIIKVSAKTASEQGFIIAYEMDGQPLNEALRLVVPGYPGNFWISQINEIRATISTNYDIGPVVPTPTPPPTPLSFKTMPTLPPPRPTPTPEPTEMPTASATASTPTPQTSSGSNTSQLADQQMQQEPSPVQNPTTSSDLLILATIVTAAIGVSLLLFKRKSKQVTKSNP